jgi:hypothetical protein
VAKRQASQVVTIIVQLTSEPFAVPKTLVTWNKGTEVPDPLRRTVSRADIAQTTVTAKIGPATRAVTIVIVDVVVSSNKDPFGAAIQQVRIEGLLNKDLNDVDVGDLFDTQPDSLFRIRADIPGLDASVKKLTAVVTSKAPNGTNIETVSVDLNRTPAGGNSYLSLPLLVVPAAIPRAEIGLKTPATLNVIRARAAGKLSVTVNSPIPLGALGTVEVVVRGTVVFIAAQSFAGSGVSAADIRRHIGLANRAWAQAGLEVKERSVVDSVPAPDGLLKLDHDVPFSGNLTAEERLLTGVTPGGPTRSAVATDLNIYYVKEINGPAAGVTYSHESFTGITDPARSVIAIEIPSDQDADATDCILTHELGHHLIVNWGADEHQNHAGKDWPDGVVMHPAVSVQKDLDREHVVHILLMAKTGLSPFIIFEP